VQLARTELPIPVPSWDHYTSSRLFANAGNGSIHVYVDYRYIGTMTTKNDLIGWEYECGARGGHHTGTYIHVPL